MLERLTGGHNPRFVEEDMGDTEFELYQRLELIEERIESAMQVLAQQAVDGQYDVNHYSLGLFNGMECIIGIIEGREPVYKSFDTMDGSDPDASEVASTSVEEAFFGEGSDDDDGDLDGGNIDDEEYTEYPAGSITGGSDVPDVGPVEVDAAYLNTGDDEDYE